jgi:hypothetical protein
MSRHDAGKVIQYTSVLPEKTRDNAYSKPQLIVASYLALKTGNAAYVPEIHDLGIDLIGTGIDNARTYIQNIINTLSGPISLEDVDEYLKDQCMTVENSRWRQVNGHSFKGQYIPHSVGEQGLKIHLTLPEKEEDAGLMACLLAGWLNEIGTVYKIVKSQDDWNILNESIQKGKAIAIYPATIKDSIQIANDISEMYEIAELCSQSELKIVDLENELLYWKGVSIRPSHYSGGDIVIGDQEFDDSLLRSNTGMQLELFEMMTRHIRNPDKKVLSLDEKELLHTLYYWHRQNRYAS